MNFRKIFAGLFLGCAALSLGQFEKIPGADYMPAIFLNQAVAKDMHLSPEVVAKEQQVMVQKGMAMMPFLSAQKQDMSMEKKKALAAKMIAAYRDMESASLAPLTASQRVRYHELSLQFFGPMALAQPKQMAALGLTPAQKSKMMNMLQSTSQAMASQIKPLQGSAQSNPMGTMSSLRSAQSQTRAIQEAGLKKILTPAQLKKWDAMQGKKLPGITNIFGGM